MAAVLLFTGIGNIKTWASDDSLEFGPDRPRLMGSAPLPRGWPEDAPVVLLSHGYPSSSFQFRNFMPALADRWRLIAPDFPGFSYISDGSTGMNIHDVQPR
jgi:pimeloyl-ACP methyl ester carboxylesterase